MLTPASLYHVAVPVTTPRHMFINQLRNYFIGDHAAGLPDGILMVSDCRLTLGQTAQQHIASHHITLPAAQVKRVEERLLARGILLRVDEAALDFLADRGFDPAYGEQAWHALGTALGIALQ
jgi:C-terminal, D2-small domain, of ClpB protein